MTREDAKRILACRGNGYSEEDFNNAIEVAFNSIPSLLSDVNEAADKYTDNPANYLEYSDDGWEDKTDIDYVERAFKAGAEWLAGQGESYNYYLEIDAYAYPFGEFGNVNIKYVHQLQHALRLCVIDKTIEI